MSENGKTRWLFMAAGLCAGFLVGRTALSGTLLPGAAALGSFQSSERLQGSATPIEPPGANELKALRDKIGKPKEKATREQLLAILEKDPKTSEKIRKAEAGEKGQALLGGKDPLEPPGGARLKEVARTAGPPRAKKLTIEELLERIPVEKRDKVRRRLPPGANRGAEGPRLVSLMGTPRHSGQRPPNELIQLPDMFGMGVPSENLAYVHTSPGIRLIYGSAGPPADEMWIARPSDAVTMPDGTKSFMTWLSGLAPVDGWYFVNVRAYSAQPVHFYRYDGQYRHLRTFQAQPGWYDYIDAFYLTRGWHKFLVGFSESPSSSSAIDFFQWIQWVG